MDVTWCLNPTIRGGTQRGSKQRRELVSTHLMVQKPSVHQLQTFLYHFQNSLENAREMSTHEQCKAGISPFEWRTKDYEMEVLRIDYEHMALSVSRGALLESK